MSIHLADIDIPLQKQARDQANHLWGQLQEENLQNHLTRTQVKGLQQVVQNATLGQIEKDLISHKLQICDRRASEYKYQALKIFYRDVQQSIGKLKTEMKIHGIGDPKSYDFISVLRMYFESYCCRLYTCMEEK